MQHKMCPADPELLSEADSLLREFISQEDAESAETMLARVLSEHAEPLIRKIIRAKLQRKEEHQDADDVCSEVLVQLTHCLMTLRDAKDHGAIVNFRAYVAISAQNACYRYLRTKHPAQWRFKSKLTYLLNHKPEFQTWHDKHGQIVCSLKECEALNGLDEQHLRKAVRSDLNAFVSSNSVIVEEARGLPTSALVEALLHWLGGPIYLDDLAALMAQFLQVRDQCPPEADSTSAASSLDALRDRSPDVADRLAQSHYLACLWHEICCLPSRQRLALLLNLRETGQANALSLFVETGVVSLRQIAEAMEFQLVTFAALWNQLPLDDNSIATQMGITRQQVINLRKSARDRLERRMRVRSGKYDDY